MVSLSMPKDLLVGNKWRVRRSSSQLQSSPLTVESSSLARVGIGQTWVEKVGVESHHLSLPHRIRKRGAVLFQEAGDVLFGTPPGHGGPMKEPEAQSNKKAPAPVIIKGLEFIPLVLTLPAEGWVPQTCRATARALLLVHGPHLSIPQSSMYLSSQHP